MSPFSRDYIARILLPILRSYIRFLPFSFGKRFLFESVIDPYFSWRTFSHISTTIFGIKISTRLPDQIQSRIYFFGAWEPQITAFVRDRLKSGDIFIDVGANIGYYTLLAASLVGATGKVFAIEASPTIFNYLKNNILLNDFRNIQTFQEAASDHEGVLDVFLAPDSNIGATTTLPDEANTKGCIHEASVPTRTLDAIIGKEELLAARLLKIDVEGAEKSVIDGIAHLLPYFSNNTEWVFEITPKALKSSNDGVVGLFNLFRDAGYTIYQIPNSYTDFAYIPVRMQFELVALEEVPTEQIDVVATKLF
jgi:FkbM family methyltransferase